MGHGCRICNTVMANEKFSGNGHKQHICKKCASRPEEEIRKIEQEYEIFGYLKQSNISQKNLSRLEILSKSSDSKIAELATIVFAVGKVKSYKHRRLEFLAKNHRELLEKLEKTGLILAHHQ